MTTADICRCQAVCLTNRAAALKMLNRLPEALEDCRSAMARDRGYVKAYTRAARYHLQRAETEQARDCLQDLSQESLTAEESAEIEKIDAEIRELHADMSKLEQVRTTFRISARAYNLRHSAQIECACETTAHCRRRRTGCGVPVG